MAKKQESALDVAVQQLHNVARLMDLAPEVVKYLEQPQRFMAVQIPVRMDDGSMKYFKGYRSQHNWAIGPTRGGTRLHHEETEDDVKALSFWMTIKNSLAGIPSGGGKGGIVVNPKTLSKGEFERLCRGYIRAISPMLSPDVDVFGPDVGTPPHVMAWFMDEYDTICRHHNPRAFSGKPLILGGSLGRDKATGYGLVYSVIEVLRRQNTTLKGKTIAIQGYGNLGTHAANLFTKLGAKVIAISDQGGAIYNAKGIDPAKALAHKEKTGSVAKFAGTSAISAAELLELACDILVPAALQNQITKDNAGKIKAKYIAEGANGPTTPEAEAIMLKNGVTLLPDIMANFGGVLVSYFEQVQNRYCYAWTEEKVLESLEASITRSTSAVCELAAEKKIPMRQAAWVLALTRVVEAMKYRGWIA